MATQEQYRNAARKLPKDRTPHEQALVDKGRNMQDVRNLDHDAKRRQEIWG